MKTLFFTAYILLSSHGALAQTPAMSVVMLTGLSGNNVYVEKWSEHYYSISLGRGEYLQSAPSSQKVVDLEASYICKTIVSEYGGETCRKISPNDFHFINKRNWQAAKKDSDLLSGGAFLTKPKADFDYAEFSIFQDLHMGEDTEIDPDIRAIIERDMAKMKMIRANNPVK